MQNKICAIHQPNFFPWLGYFDKIQKCDKFVILDSVQFPKTGGGGWSNRVSLNFHGKSQWFTAPINRPEGLWNINETTFRQTNWRAKLIKTLQANYAKSPNFKEHKDLIFELVDFKTDNLSEYNINIIKEMCGLLNIDIEDKIVLSSDFNLQTSSNQLLIDLTKKVECDIYMAGAGADGYQEIELFKKQGIGFIYQEFQHPVYEQVKTKEFIKGLSVIVYIFCTGSKEFGELV